MVLLGIIAAGCDISGEDPNSVTTSSDFTQPVPTEGQPIPGESSGGETRPSTETTVTQADPPAAPAVLDETAGGAYALTGDQRVVIRLANSWVWNGPEVTGDAVEVVPVQYRVDPGYTEWEIRPIKSGVTSLTWHGTPNCEQAANCSARSVTFTFSVTR